MKLRLWIKGRVTAISNHYTLQPCDTQHVPQVFSTILPNMKWSIWSSGYMLLNRVSWSHAVDGPVITPWSELAILSQMFYAVSEAVTWGSSESPGNLIWVQLLEITATISPTVVPTPLHKYLPCKVDCIFQNSGEKQRWIPFI